MTYEIMFTVLSQKFFILFLFIKNMLEPAQLKLNEYFFTNLVENIKVLTSFKDIVS